MKEALKGHIEISAVQGEESDAEAYLGALICPLGDVFIEYTRPNVLDYSRRVLHW
jgi:hypothetical protein